jgi:TPR repeat protein
MNRPDADGNAMPVGDWRITEVRDSEVTAVLIRRMAGDPSEGMEVLFSSSGGAELHDGADVEVPGTASSGVPGKVTEVRGDTITVRLDREATPAVGDRVEVSYKAGEDTIPLGTWRVTDVGADGRVNAEPEEALGQPTPRMDALVFATGRTPPASEVQDTGKGGGGTGRADRLFAEAKRIQPEDPVRALELLVQAADLGHAGAAEWAGGAYERGRGTAPDDVKAAAYYRQAAEAGRPVAQNNYGAFLAHGRGVARDDAQAVMWYQRAAAQGDAWAQANLCARYEEGDGVQKDLDEALRLCRLSEAQNNPLALNQLGWMHQRGSGVEKDLDKAFQYYLRAAELGHENGQNNVAYCYEHGWGVDRDYGKALEWYRKSAAQGWPWAEWNLGRMYSEGIGVPADQAKAVEHWQRAARAGHSASREKLQALGVTW